MLYIHGSVECRASDQWVGEQADVGKEQLAGVSQGQVKAAKGKTYKATREAIRSRGNDKQQILTRNLSSRGQSRGQRSNAEKDPEAADAYYSSPRRSNQQLHGQDPWDVM